MTSPSRSGHRQGTQPPRRSWRNLTRPKHEAVHILQQERQGGLSQLGVGFSQLRRGHVGQQGSNALAAMQDQVTQMAAMTMEVMTKWQDDELNAVRFYRPEEIRLFVIADPMSTSLRVVEDEQVIRLFVIADPMSTSLRVVEDGQVPLHVGRTVQDSTTRSESVMEIEVLIGTRRFCALINTSCPPSAVEATYRQADRRVGRTTDVASMQIALPVFSSSHAVVRVFCVVSSLLYPVILGKVFLSRQGINLMFAAKQLEWDELTVPMATRSDCTALTEEQQRVVANILC
ncbi:hypothetical protein GN958_ATG21605 [Phytophthora infestans]|uniref:Uncharacterized protein n=1 Tax=Phytophthora infestans TaxID=4787 RepID=A0A8S9TLS0_PHYIN|nr:hypothetical protein GN958_ATG21605 [Phytophthora infestans]